MKHSRTRPIVLFSVIIVCLVALTSLTGLFMPSIYLHETANWQAQAIGQDYINLFIAAILLITSLPPLQETAMGPFAWAGVVAYLIYTYLIYCFAVHFNV